MDKYKMTDLNGNLIDTAKTIKSLCESHNISSYWSYGYDSNGNVFYAGKIPSGYKDKDGFISEHCLIYRI